MADGGRSGLPSANRGVRRSGSGDARREALARGRLRRGPVEADLKRAAESASRTWAGIDWIAGSVDVGDLLQAAGWWSTGERLQDDMGEPVVDLDGLAAHLRAYGPKRKKKGEEADADGVLVVGDRPPFVEPDAIVRSIVHTAFRYLFDGTGLKVAEKAGPGPFYAYKFMLLNVWDEPAGMIEVGGELTQRKGGRPSLRIELTGLGCAIFEQRGGPCADHAQLWSALRAKLARVGAMLTRVDIAFDDFDGKRNLALAKCMYECGEFDYRFAGEQKRPKFKEFNTSGDGNTFYVGHSSSEKQLRVYEKGKQLGDLESPWVRWELQLRSSSKKRLALVVLDDPMAYMRGAFECLDFVASCMKRLEVTGEVSKATAKSVLRHYMRMYGATNWMLRRLAPDAESAAWLLDALSREKVPKWAKRGGLTWADIPGLVPSPDNEENGDGHE